jgi:endonuclease YncB( thermonuclease family)
MRNPFHFCNGLKVWLDGMDAPESKEPFYWESRQALADLLQTRDIKVFDCRTDSTGKRQACQVYADGKDVQAEMVKEGMAWDWPKYSGGRYAQQEQDAKASKQGVWVNDQATQLHWGVRKRL